MNSATRVQILYECAAIHHGANNLYMNPSHNLKLDRRGFFIFGLPINVREGKLRFKPVDDWD